MAKSLINPKNGKEIKENSLVWLDFGPGNRRKGYVKSLLKGETITDEHVASFGRKETVGQQAVLVYVECKWDGFIYHIPETYPITILSPRKK